MIRFLDLKDQITEGDCDFAFFDTVTGQIESFDKEQVWTTLEEFKYAYDHEYDKKKPIDRYLRLIPDGFFTTSKYHVIKEADMNKIIDSKIKPYGEWCD